MNVANEETALLGYNPTPIAKIDNEIYTTTNVGNRIANESENLNAKHLKTLFYSPPEGGACNGSKRHCHYREEKGRGSWRRHIDGSPNSETSRLWMMNCEIGLLPSKPGVQDTLMARWWPNWVSSSLVALTLVGGKGNSITLSRAERVSLPPGDDTTHE